MLIFDLRLLPKCWKIGTNGRPCTCSTPLIDVRTLAAFAHCPNAGKIEYLRQSEDDNPTYDRIANLSYTPSFDYARLREQEKTYRVRVLWWVAFLIAELLITWLLFSAGHWGYSMWLIPAMAPTAYFAWRDVHWYWQIIQQLGEFNKSQPMPLPDSTSLPVRIEWWSLVKAGLITGQLATTSIPEIGLSGRPWRMLVNERVRQKIPVIRHFTHFGNQIAVTSSHRLQLAACALLIENQEGTEVDWGVVIDAKSLRGFAVPIKAADKELVIERLGEYRELATHWSQVPDRTSPGVGLPFLSPLVSAERGSTNKAWPTCPNALPVRPERGSPQIDQLANRRELARTARSWRNQHHIFCR